MTLCGPLSALPVLSQPVIGVTAASSTMQPAVPAFWVRAPLVVSRSKTATASSVLEAT